MDDTPERDVPFTFGGGDSLAIAGGRVVKGFVHPEWGQNPLAGDRF